jgi:DNA-binding transcriptional LysR family regulator
MEGDLGAQLFERSNGGTHPTLAGREFLASVQHILEEVDVAVRKLRTKTKGDAGHLKIGVYASLSTGNMFATLLEHHHRFPGVDVLTVDGSHDQLLKSLDSGAVDIAVMTASRSAWRDRLLALWSERLIVALHARHPLSKQERVHWPDLAGETILIPHYGPGPELERLLMSRLADYGTQRLLHQEAGLDRLLTLVAAQYGVLLMFEGGTGNKRDNIIYREIYGEDGPARLNFTAYWCESNNNPALGPFIALLQQRFPDLAPGPSYATG